MINPRHEFDVDCISKLGQPWFGYGKEDDSSGRTRAADCPVQVGEGRERRGGGMPVTSTACSFFFHLLCRPPAYGSHARMSISSQCGHTFFRRVM